MEFYQLRTFIEIARTGNLTEAAVRLNMSQPAASAHIKALEKEVGFTLFHRIPKGMMITEKGSKLLADAQKILESVDHFYHKSNGLYSDSIEKILIGLNTDGEVLKIKEMIQLVSKEIPKAELHFVKTRSEDFLKDLDISKINAGFYYGKVLNSAIQAIKLHSFEMVVVYTNSWNLESNDLSLEFFSKTPWIWTTKGCPFYRESMAFFEKQGINPQKIMYVDDELLIGELVQAEIGCSLLAEPIAMRFAEEKKLKVWKGVNFNIDLYFGFPKEVKNTPVLIEMSSILHDIWRRQTQNSFNPADN